MEEKLTRVQPHCLAIHTKDKRQNPSKKICICELLSSDRQSAVYMTRHAFRKQTNVGKSLKINLGHCFHHYMVAVCFTRQQKDTKKKKKKKKKRTEVKHFVFTCSVSSEI